MQTQEYISEFLLSEPNERQKAGIIPHWRFMPKAVKDLQDVLLNTEALHFSGKTKNLQRLLRFDKTTDVIATEIGDEVLQLIARLPKAKRVSIMGSKNVNVSILKNTSTLRILYIDSDTKTENLEAFAELKQLVGLNITHFKRIHDLSPLGKLTNLETLAVEGDNWVTTKVKSLTPLATLIHLEKLFLCPLAADDQSLRPLAALPKLGLLACSNTFPMAEFAWLAGRKPKLKCDWFEPVLEWKGLFPCRKCFKERQVMLSGRGAGFACLDCQSRKIQKHRTAFDKIKAGAQ